MGPNSTLEAVVDAAVAALRAKQVGSAGRVADIRAALAAYVAAVESEIAGEFATKNGYAWTSTSGRPLTSALSLRSLVEALPELRGQPAALPSPPPSSPITQREPPPSSGLANSTPARSAVREPEPPRTYSAAANADAAVLLREVRALDLEGMNDARFRAWAEEIAAKARALQDAGADPDIPTRIIRKLTAIAFEKGMNDVFGLNRRHTANWDEVFTEARARRKMIESGGGAAQTQKIPVLRTSSR